MRTKIFVAVFVGMMLSGGLAAQKDTRQERFKDLMKERIRKELNLSSEQMLKMDEIEKKYKPEEDRLLKQREEAIDGLRKLRKAKKSELEKILTPEQLDKLEKLKEERKERRTENREKFKEQMKEKWSDQ